jgi:hypothetical protein
LEKEIPELAEAIAKAWSEKIKIPDWLIEFCT